MGGGGVALSSYYSNSSRWVAAICLSFSGACGLSSSQCVTRLLVDLIDKTSLYSTEIKRQRNLMVLYCTIKVLQEELKLAKESVQTSVANHVNSAAPAEVNKLATSDFSELVLVPYMKLFFM